jgi:hypothetical protein
MSVGVMKDYKLNQRNLRASHIHRVGADVIKSRNNQEVRISVIRAGSSVSVGFHEDQF